MGLYDEDTHWGLCLSESAGNNSSETIKPCFECGKRLDNIEPVLDANGFIDHGYVELDDGDGTNMCLECDEKCMQPDGG